MSLEESYNPQIALDVFKEDPDFQQTEKEYEVSHPHSPESLERHTGAAQLLLAPQDVPALPRGNIHTSAFGLCSCESPQKFRMYGCVQMV